ncbi:MAG: DUF3253 domain-containing protein [Rhodospirillales bacterium]|nr:DUF3253 domain-containing protein [Rhodospirillales bacterium]
MEQKPRLDPIARLILEMAAGAASISPNDVARAFAESRKNPKDTTPPDWHRYLHAVRQQALFLAREGRIAFVRKGETADPEKVKGLFRLRLMAPGEVIIFPDDDDDDQEYYE